MKSKKIFFGLIVLFLAIGIVFLVIIEQVFTFQVLSYDEFEEVYAVDLCACPLGHETLKDVPIRYGLLNRDAGMQQDIEDLKIWSGGCIPQAPQNRVVCTVCRYSYDSCFKQWTKRSKGKDDFAATLSEVIGNFPFASDSEQMFRQCNLHRGPRISDEASYWTKIGQKEIDRTIHNYLEATTLEFARVERPIPELGRNYIEYRARNGPNYVYVELMQDDGATHVRAEESSEKPHGY